MDKGAYVQQLVEYQVERVPGNPATLEVCTDWLGIL